LARPCFQQKTRSENEHHCLQDRSSSHTKQGADVPVQHKYYIGGALVPGEIVSERDSTVVTARLAAAK